MTLILGDINKRSLITPTMLDTDLKECIRQLDRDIQRLFIALRPDLIVDLTDAATIETDVSIAIHFRVVLGGNRTLQNPTNPRDGQKVIWEFVQDSTGSRTITLDTKFDVGNDVAVTLSTVAGAIDFMGATYDSPNDKWRVLAFVTGYA